MFTKALSTNQFIYEPIKLAIMNGNKWNEIEKNEIEWDEVVFFLARVGMNGME